MTDPPEVVVLRALGLGDLLTAVPALRALARHFPDRRLVVLTPRYLSEVLTMARIDAAVVDWHGLVGVPELPAPDVAVNLHGRGPESHRLLQGLGPDQLIAFRHEWVHEEGPWWDPAEHERDRWCRLLAHYGIPTDPADLRIEKPSGQSAVGSAVTVIHPGAKDPARQWPIGRWAEIVRRETRAGRRVAITGSVAERRLGEAVADLAGVSESFVAAGRTDIAGLAATVAQAEMVVCGDTGVAHLATALGVPAVMLFGPTDPARWGPPPGGPHRVLWKGRTGDPHASTPDPGLLEISPQEVAAAMDALRSQPKSAAS